MGSTLAMCQITILPVITVLQTPGGRLFQYECMFDSIVEFFGLRPMIYLFSEIDAEDYDPRLPVEPVQIMHKAVAKGVSRACIKRCTHEEYVTMFPEGDARKVTTRRIGLKLHQVNYSN